MHWLVSYWLYSATSIIPERILCYFSELYGALGSFLKILRVCYVFLFCQVACKSSEFVYQESVATILFPSLFHDYSVTLRKSSQYVARNVYVLLWQKVCVCVRACACVCVCICVHACVRVCLMCVL